MFDLDVHAPNIMPSRYRQVTTATVASLDPDELRKHFSDREAYRRSRFVVAHNEGRQALVELARSTDDALFSRTIGARVIAGADECVMVTDPAIDCGNGSHLAAVAAENPEARCVIVEGRYEHISFLMNPAPIEIEVVDIVPPEPSKLVDQARRVLDVAEDLPPIVLQPTLIDSRALLAEERPTSRSVLVPCRGGGVRVADIDVSYLDERPARRNWALLGCHRSQQIHQWFYHEEAEYRVDICPRRFIDDAPSTAPLLGRCCLREEGIETRGSVALVPWGSSLGEVRQALEQIVDAQDVTWTHL